MLFSEKNLSQCLITLALNCLLGAGVTALLILAKHIKKSHSVSYRCQLVKILQFQGIIAITILIILFFKSSSQPKSNESSTQTSKWIEFKQDFRSNQNITFKTPQFAQAPQSSTLLAIENEQVFILEAFLSSLLLSVSFLLLTYLLDKPAYIINTKTLIPLSFTVILSKLNFYFLSISFNDPNLLKVSQNPESSLMSDPVYLVITGCIFISLIFAGEVGLTFQMYNQMFRQVYEAQNTWTSVFHTNYFQPMVTNRKEEFGKV